MSFGKFASLVLGVGLLGVVVAIWVMPTKSQEDPIPSLGRPGPLEALLHSFADNVVRETHRDVWRGLLDVERLNTAENSAFASGAYETAVDGGVDPEAVGRVSDQELLLLRQDREITGTADWRLAPPDIRREYERHKVRSQQ